METEHRVQSRLAKNQNRRDRGSSIDAYDYSSAVVSSSPAVPQRQVLGMEMPIQQHRSPQALSWQNTEPAVGGAPLAWMHPNQQVTTVYNSGFGTE